MDFQAFLKRYEAADLLRLSTAGSVDDGKSTLIGRLLHDTHAIYEDQLASLQRAAAARGADRIDLAFLTDGLKAEREQGITIDVAYRYFATPKRLFIIADTPGHEQYTRNMVTGASTAALALILVDARKGVLTQSKRHGFLAALLGIQHVVVAVNKMDLVGYSEEAFERIAADYAAFAAKLDLPDLTFIPISALEGDNVVAPSPRLPWYKGAPLLPHLETVQVAGHRNLIDFRFPVQYVLRPDPDFRGYSGQIAGGIVRVGDEVRVLPSGQTSRVKRIVTFDGDLEYAFTPQSVTLCLDDEIDIGRGDMLVHPHNLPRVDTDLEAMLVWMDGQRFQIGKQYLIKQTTRLIRGQFTRLHYKIDPNELHRLPAGELQLNEIGRVEMHLFKPLFCDEYRRNRNTGSFIVIDPLTNGTVGAGMIIEREIHRGGAARAAERAGTIDRNVTAHTGHVTGADRERLLRQKPATIWLTGLSGAGKSTIAYALERRLLDAGQACYVLDGDNIRLGLNRDLGFSPDDRKENIRRIAAVARLFNDAGLLVITAFISPYREDRNGARQTVGAEHFVEVFVDAPLAVCEGRDPRGLYRKARAGQIAEFTGVSAPYEPPAQPECRVRTDTTSVALTSPRTIKSRSSWMVSECRSMPITSPHLLICTR